jgi:hypothetical protein
MLEGSPRSLFMSLIDHTSSRQASGFPLVIALYAPAHVNATNIMATADVYRVRALCQLV